MENNQSKGILYAFGASVALAGSFVFSKSVLDQLPMVHFGLIWFSLGVVWNAGWFIGRREYHNLSAGLLPKTGVALLIAILEGAATALFYLAIRKMDNPAVVSFIGNMGPVFVTLFGLTLLRERFRSGQMAGIFITIVGVFLINYRDGGFQGFLDPGAPEQVGGSAEQHA